MSGQVLSAPVPFQAHKGIVWDQETAEDGNDGLEKAKAESPQLIVTDLHMPGLHGLELIKQLRQIPELSKIPILILTADVDGKEQAIEAGASSVLIKPTGYEKLAETIKHLLEMS